MILGKGELFLEYMFTSYLVMISIASCLSFRCSCVPGGKGVETRQSGQALAGEVDRVRFDTQQVDTGRECAGMRLELFYYY
jgi:hypothetical protein